VSGSCGFSRDSGGIAPGALCIGLGARPETTDATHSAYGTARFDLALPIVRCRQPGVVDVAVRPAGCRFFGCGGRNRWAFGRGQDGGLEALRRRSTPLLPPRCQARRDTPCLQARSEFDACDLIPLCLSDSRNLSQRTFETACRYPVLRCSLRSLGLRASRSPVEATLCIWIGYALQPRARLFDTFETNHESSPP